MNKYLEAFDNWLTEQEEKLGIPCVYDHKHVGVNNPQLYFALKKISKKTLGGCSFTIDLEIFLIAPSPSASNLLGGYFENIAKIEQHLGNGVWEPRELAIPQKGVISAISCEHALTIEEGK